MLIIRVECGAFSTLIIFTFNHDKSLQDIKRLSDSDQFFFSNQFILIPRRFLQVWCYRLTQIM